MESLSDIVAMLRANARGERFDEFSFTSLADSIEAAWRREKAETEARALEVGGTIEASRHKECNTAAMRDALEKLNQWLYIGPDGRVHGLHNKTGEIERTIKTAISAKPRNCDVGTAARQTERFWGYCNSHSCNECPARGGVDNEQV